LADIEIARVSKVFPNGVRALDDVSLRVADGEFMVLVGPSGCGKSTLLRLLAGLDEVTEGAVLVDGEDITELAPRRRDVAMVFQNYALYPHMSVRQNLGYGLKVRRAPKSEVARRVDEVARLLGLDELLERRPSQLSGGQRQRVAMGRAIVREPKAFLMDEPLSNLDAKLRVGMRASLTQLHARLGVTTVYVTHDQVEAMTLGQRVAVMRDGRILQVDTPQRLYREPANLFVAAFIGSPAMNLVDARIDGDEIVFGEFRVPLDRRRRPPAGVERVVLGMRPESFEDADFARGEDAAGIDVVVEVVEELGSDAHLFFHVDAPPVAGEARAAREDDTTLLAEDRALFTARVDERTAARPGARATLTVDASRFHFFDPDTGASLLEPRRATAPVAVVPSAPVDPSLLAGSGESS
jgi:multiple sugar transport system ATP-binding protein